MKNIESIDSLSGDHGHFKAVSDHTEAVHRSSKDFSLILFIFREVQRWAPMFFAENI